MKSSRGTRRSARRPALVAAVLVVALAASADAQYCALRDPVRTIHELFPEATDHRSIVRTVDESARSAVSEQLQLDLHFNELGRHTLYAVLQETCPIGLVHVRSEQGRWGLIENAWAFDLDLRILDFRFQRCRDPLARRLEADVFVAQLRGKGRDELRALLTPDGRSLVPGALDVPADTEALAATVIRSALKTIVVTDAVWHDDLRTLRLARAARRAFPASVALEPVDAVYRPDLIASLDAIVGAASVIDRSRTSVLRARDADGVALGLLVRTTATDDMSIELWWAVALGGRITGVWPRAAWPDDLTAAAFQGLIGLTVDEIDQCATAAQLAGAEVLLVSGAHAEAP